MRARILILLLWLGYAGTAGAAAERVVFHGNREFSSADLTRFLSVESDSGSTANRLNERLAALVDSLAARDFLFAQIDSARGRDGKRRQREWHVYLREGSLARLAALRWLGDSTRVSAAVAARALCRSGAVFRWSNVEFDTELLLNYFETVGYPFARIDVQKLESDSVRGTVDLWLLLSSGPLAKLEFLSFPGNRHTKESFLRREARLPLGGVYDQRRIDAARRHLRRLDFIRRVDPAEVAVNSVGQTGLRLPLEEGRATRLDIAAGYVPQAENRPALLSGLVNVEFLNLFGAGRRARLHWERPDKRIQAVEVAYREPWILNQPLALRVDFAQRIEDTLYVTRRIGLRGELELPSNFGLWGTVQQEAVIADSQSAAALGLPDSRTTYFESGLSYDTRDHPTNPRGGVFFSTFAGTGWRQRERNAAGLPPGSFRHHRVGLESEIAQELLPFWIGDLGLHARALQTTEPEVLLPDLYRLGGARTLRGYREEQFLGSRIGWASAELRYWLGPASRVFLFFDAGSVYRQPPAGSLESTSTLFRTGQGIGLRLETDLGIWGIDYGVGEGDALLGGKLHISLLSTF